MHYIMVVDDDEEDIDSLLHAIHSNLKNVNVKSFLSGQDLMDDLVKTSVDAFPLLIIIDQELSNLNGISLVKKLRSAKMYRTIPLILISGYIPQSLVKQLYEEGANCFFPKPVDMEGWIHVIECVKTLFLNDSIL